ncbi:MAG: PQQ-binding-like beta-propeller repeat protein [Candidatus Brocadiae bacterium]|nr:PQQ-binding-like beta-propeller repeat protein [Candidatus Brocadiia bacterium]
MTGMLHRVAAGLLCLGAITARGQSSQHNAGDKKGTLHCQKANMHLRPEDKWTLGSDKWGKIVRVNMLKITAADWAQVPGVKKAWPMKGFEGVEGMAFHPVISEVKDVDGDGTPDVFRCRSEHPGARIERLRYGDGSVVWESEPMGALHGDESRLPVFDLHGAGRFSVLHATKDGTWCINADTGKTEWAARGGGGDIIVGHFLDRKTQAVVVRDAGVLHCYDHTGKKAWTHDTRLRGGSAYAHEMGRCDVDGDGLDEIFPNWQKLTMGLRGDGMVLWEDRTQRHHSDFMDYGDVDEDGNIEVIYDHEGCGAAKGPIYVVEPISGKIKARIDYRKQGVRHAQNIALGNFDRRRKGLEIAFCEKGNNIYLFSASGELVWKRPVPASLLSRGDWNGDGDEEILAFGLGANVDGMFSVWDGDGTRLYAISFLPCPYHRGLDSATYKRNLGGTWRAHAMPGGHEGIRRQVDLDGNGRADVIMPFGEWHWGSDSILFLMESHMESPVREQDR